ncbi:MAG: glycosyltransferase family 39 protein [Magnetococcales bacterium]|nr:glycosyltransferase family 39 protein [Magnetococcales bacterium]
MLNQNMATSELPTKPQLTAKWLWALAGIVGLHLLFYFWAHPVFKGSDDLAYAQLANRILTDTYQLTPGHFVNRFGLFIPTALSFKLFGFNGYAATLWPLLASTLTIITLFWVTWRMYGAVAAFFAGLLLATNPFQITYTLVLMPDVVISAYMFLGGVVLWFSREVATTRGCWRLGALVFAGTFWLGALTKLTILWLLPFALVLMIHDLGRGRHAYFWGWTLALGVVGGILYGLPYYLVTGNPFYRLAGVNHATVTAGDSWNFVGKPLMAYVDRLTWEPLRMLLREPGYLTVLMLSMPVLGRMGRSWRGVDHQKVVGEGEGGASLQEDAEGVRGVPGGYFWGLYFWLVLLAFWFGTRSYSHYSPMHLMPRMWLPILPPLCILAGVFLAALFSAEAEQWQGLRKQLLVVSISCVVLAVLLKYLGYNKRAVVFAGIPVFFALFQAFSPWRQRTPRWLYRGGFVGLVVLVLTATGALPIMNGAVGETPRQRFEREMVIEQLSDEEQGIVLSDRRTILAAAYHLGFGQRSGLGFVAWELWRQEGRWVQPAKVAPDTPLFILVNPHRLKPLAGAYGWEVPPFVDHPPPGWKRLAGQEGIYLYRVEGLAALPLTPAPSS